ncbi:hypothetical protein ACO0QE_001743 [Hanseniaspora vineae]
MTLCNTFSLSSALLLLASTGLVTQANAAYLTTCNPLKESNCPADSGLNANIDLDFSSESETMKYFTDYSGTGQLNYSDTTGLSLTLAKRFDNPSLKSNFYIMYGRMELVMQAAPGQGIVSTVYLQSDDLDEIDWEWLGTDTTQVQTNFYSKGNVTTYDRGQYNTVNGDPTSGYHNYTIDWSDAEINWYIDDQVVRTLANTTSDGYPQTPMAIYLGVWAGGDPSNGEGTIEWAGGATDYTKAPFTMNVKSLKVADYSNGDSYSYSGTSGSADSIQVSGGSVNGRMNEAIASWGGAIASSTTQSSASSTASSSSSSFSSASSSASTSSSSATASSSLSSTASSSASSSDVQVSSTVNSDESTSSESVSSIASSSISVASTAASTSVSPSISATSKNDQVSSSVELTSVTSSFASSTITTASSASATNSSKTIKSSSSNNYGQKLEMTSGFLLFSLLHFLF